jgi:hypothetical protein
MSAMEQRIRGAKTAHIALAQQLDHRFVAAHGSEVQTALCGQDEPAARWRNWQEAYALVVIGGVGVSSDV